MVTGRTESVQCKKKKIKAPKSAKVHKVANWEACKTLCNRDDKCSYFIYRVGTQKKSKHYIELFTITAALGNKEKANEKEKCEREVLQIFNTS